MADFTLLIWIHVIGAIAAMLFGALTFMMPKGGARHRRWARLYVAAMLVTTGVVIFVPATVMPIGIWHFGFFHLFILIGGISALVGIYALRQWFRIRDPEWLRNHQIRFAFSYAGLWMAGVAQLVTNPDFGIIDKLSPEAFWIVFAAANLAVFGIAAFFVGRYLMRGDPRRRYALKP
ncbi:MAG: hypothetical protein EX258_04130 [Sphingomonadaceae bacterium]|nr:MAG: hypothetical protein EX258_04130 [Sphingomonadaceae bacterium]